jgi:opacity protein-like surface antigen
MIMKKVFMLAAAALMTTGAMAQGWEYGVKAGVDFSKVSKISGGKAKALTGFYGGVFAEYHLNDFFGIQPELVYSAQGTQFNAESGKFEIRQNYINVPILAKFYVLNGLSVEVGPQFGFLMNSKIKLKSGAGSYVFAPAIRKFDFAAAMGLTYTVSSRLDITARYNLGLTDSYDYTGKNRQNVIQIGLGYRF